MPKFRKKPVVIEAEQYLLGEPLPKGAKATFPEVVFSVDQKLFYVTHTDAKHWLAVEANADGKFDTYLFAFYSIKSSYHCPADERKDLVDLYLEVFNLLAPLPHVWVETIHKGQSVTLADGDWVIPEPDGIHFYPCKPEIFQKTYEPA